MLRRVATNHGIQEFSVAFIPRNFDNMKLLVTVKDQQSSSTTERGESGTFMALTDDSIPSVCTVSTLEGGGTMLYAFGKCPSSV